MKIKSNPDTWDIPNRPFEFIGRACFCTGRGRLFDKYLAGCQDYIEIGTLFGGSAVEAGQRVSGEVHCVDPLYGYNGEQGRTDPECGLIPSPAIVRKNWQSAGLAQDRLFLHIQKTPPLPTSLAGRMFDVAYIDGDHSVEGAMSDWKLLRDRVRKFILFDDINNKPAVRHAVQVAAAERDWELVHDQVLGVLKRV